MLWFLIFAQRIRASRSPPLLLLQYKVGDRVNLWVNKVGPYHNPQETYEYFKLPYCKVRLPRRGEVEVAYSQRDDRTGEARPAGHPCARTHGRGVPPLSSASAALSITPFCSPALLLLARRRQPELGIANKKKALSMGEQLEGHDLTNSGYDLHFGQDVPPTKLCSQTLDRETSVVFSSAVEVHYW